MCKPPLVVSAADWDVQAAGVHVAIERLRCLWALANPKIGSRIDLP